MIDKSQIRDAATVILIRMMAGRPNVLLGLRGKAAAFMPNKFVFPGGAVDATDYGLLPGNALQPVSRRRLETQAAPNIAPALAAACIRELWEETGLALSKDGVDFAQTPPPDWHDFVNAGHKPAPGALHFMFRAITPPGRPRRFDARFFLCMADQINGDLDDFGAASGELSHLQWVPLAEARALELPFITEVVLAEVEDQVATQDFQRPVPFFNNQSPNSSFESIE